MITLNHTFISICDLEFYYPQYDLNKEWLNVILFGTTYLSKEQMAAPQLMWEYCEENFHTVISPQYVHCALVKKLQHARRMYYLFSKTTQNRLSFKADYLGGCPGLSLDLNHGNMRLGILTDGESGKSAQLLRFALFLWTQIRNYFAE